MKALSDVICTSGNAVKIVEASPKDKNLLFVPDENLGAWVMEPRLLIPNPESSGLAR